MNFGGRNHSTRGISAWTVLLGVSVLGAVLYFFMLVATDPQDHVTLLNTGVRTEQSGARFVAGTLLALALCCAVELSQLYHAPGLDALRRTTLGNLVLGSGFDPRDLFAYAAGVFVAALLDRSATRNGDSAPVAGARS